MIPCTLLLLMPTLLWAAPQSDGGLVCTQPTVHLGRITQGQKVRHRFTLENRSGRLLRIREVTSSCDCTTAPLSRQELAPGEALSLEVTFDSTRFEGPVEKSLAVHTEGPPLLLALKAHVVRPYRLQPEVLRFPATSRRAPLTLPLRLTAASGELPPAVAAALSGDDGFTVESAPVREDRAQEVLLTLRPDTPARVVRATLTLTLNDEARTRMEVPVAGELTEDLSWFPAQPDLGSIPQGSPASRRLQLLLHHPAVTVERITSDAPWLEVALQPRQTPEGLGSTLSPLRGFTVTFRPQPSAPLGPATVTLTIHASGSDRPRVTLPLTLVVTRP